MWKKVTAIVGVPVALLLTYAAVQAVGITLKRMPDGADGYQIGYLIGAGLGALFTVLLMFLLWRWILRTLAGRPRAEKP